MPEKSGIVAPPCVAASDDPVAGATACPRTGVAAAAKVTSNSKPWRRFILASLVAVQSLRRNLLNVKSKNEPRNQDGRSRLGWKRCGNNGPGRTFELRSQAASLQYLCAKAVRECVS